MSSGNILKVITAALREAQIPYMIVGSFASNLYGSARGTQDIDVVVSASPEAIAHFLDSLPRGEYYFDVATALEACRRRDMFNILDMGSGWKVDVIFKKMSAYGQQAFQRRVAAEIEQIPLYAATAEDVIISKLEWAKMGASLRQIEDVSGILKERHELLDFIYLDGWIKQLGLAEQWNAARKAAGLP